jgi:hypothetical protein
MFGHSQNLERLPNMDDRVLSGADDLQSSLMLITDQHEKATAAYEAYMREHGLTGLLP